LQTHRALKHNGHPRNLPENCACFCFGSRTKASHLFFLFVFECPISSLVDTVPSGVTCSEKRFAISILLANQTSSNFFAYSIKRARASARDGLSVITLFLYRMITTWRGT